MKETFKEAGYTYVRYLGNGEHLLRWSENNFLEIWFSNKNHASYGLKYKNTHLEFVRNAGYGDTLDARESNPC
jgi:hypothetical protein